MIDRSERDGHLRERIDAIYDELTDGRRFPLRVAELVDAAADRFPDVVPSREAMDAERQRLQKDKDGLEIDQGMFVAHVLARAEIGGHLLHSMAQPRPEALECLVEFRRTGAVDRRIG